MRISIFALGLAGVLLAGGATDALAWSRSGISAW